MCGDFDGCIAQCLSACEGSGNGGQTCAESKVTIGGYLDIAVGNGNGDGVIVGGEVTIGGYLDIAVGNGNSDGVIVGGDVSIGGSLNIAVGNGNGDGVIVNGEVSIKGSLNISVGTGRRLSLRRINDNHRTIPEQLRGRRLGGKLRQRQRVRGFWQLHHALPETWRRQLQRRLSLAASGATIG